MPRAEPGTAKFASKQLKLRGLQRLRWYCQICSRQMRDENGYKQHTLSEGHVRAMQVVAEDPKKWINEYSRQFQSNFLQLLRTSHGEKPIHINRFYQEYISDKTHVHLNSTRWPSLTEFAKYLGREGICRVEEKEDGFFIQWIDNSPEAIRRREKLAKGNRQEEYEVQEQKEIQKQVERAHQNAAPSDQPAQPAPSNLDEEQWTDFKVELKKPTTPSFSVQKPTTTKKPNVFASAKRKQPQSEGSSRAPTPGQPAKMSEIERVMREDMERNNKKRKVQPANPNR